MSAIVIDIHPHVIADDDRRYPRAPVGGRQSDWSRARPVTFRQMIAAMDNADVEKSALVQASTCYGHDNSYLADAVAAYPDRFTGVFSVDVLAPDAPDRMREWARRGLTGMRLFMFGSTVSEQAPWLDDPKTYPAWECAAELGLSICLQMAPEAIPQAINMAKRFPNVRIVIDHGGRATLSDGPPYRAASPQLGLSQYPNIYLKLTPRVFEQAASGKATPDTFFPLLVSEFGAARLAWGSNFPATEGSLADILAFARQSLACLSEQDRAWIFAKTAQTLYPKLAD